MPEGEFLRDCPKAVTEAMKTLGMKGRDVGLSTRVDTKAMSLKARYYNKKGEETPEEEGNLARGTIIRVRRDMGKKKKVGEKLTYSVLAVYRKYNGKWFMVKQSDLPLNWSKKNRDKKPVTKILINLLDRSVSTGNIWYTTVKEHQTYKEKDIYRIIDVNEVLEIIGEITT